MKLDSVHLNKFGTGKFGILIESVRENEREL